MYFKSRLGTALLRRSRHRSIRQGGREAEVRRSYFPESLVIPIAAKDCFGFQSQMRLL